MTSRKNTVKASLTPGVENADYRKFATRVVKGYARRVQAGDIDELPGLIALQAELDELARSVVANLRTSYGYSWADIAERLGVSRQAAQQRFKELKTMTTTEGGDTT